MGVDLWIIGNHSIPFKGRKIENKSKVIDLLNSLQLEKSEFLIETRKKWFTPDAEYYTSFMGEKYYEKYAKEEKEQLEKYLQLQSWTVYEEEESELDSNQYFFEGPYGLEVDINKYFSWISIWIGRYRHWFYSSENYDIQWREKWRLIVYKITNILGGNYVMYFPDNMSDLDEYLPSNYFPKETNSRPQYEVNTLEQLAEIISKKYSKPLSLSEADEIFEKRNIDPFVIDRFEDLDKTLKI